MSRVTRGNPGGEAYLDLRAQARRSGRPTDELLQLYTLEGFLSRLAASPVRDSLVLKGGMLLAAFDTRRPTRDVDLAGIDISNDSGTVLDLVRAILDVRPQEDDGIEMLLDTLTTQAIREDDMYAGVRVTVGARLASANVTFHVDVNVGDPIWPAPGIVAVPRLLGGNPIRVIGYPLQMVHAEKIVTALQRGTANTRWRDFADVWTLTRRLAIEGSDLQHAIDQVASHREAATGPLRSALAGFPELAQPRWAAWRRRNSFEHCQNISRTCSTGSSPSPTRC